MPEFTVFWVDDLAGRAEAITAISADVAVARHWAGKRLAKGSHDSPLRERSATARAQNRRLWEP